MKTQIRKGMMVVFAVGGFLLLSSMLQAECKIEISADPALPAENILKNPGFEEGNKSWSYFREEYKDGKSKKLGTNEQDGISEEESHSGKYSYKLIGEKEIRKMVFQHYLLYNGKSEFNPSIPAGTPIYISAWTKSVGTSYSGGNYSLGFVVGYTNDTSSYLRAPSFPKGEHDWMMSSSVAIPKKDVKKIVYLHGGIYHNQEGVAYFDDVFIGVGNTKLTYKVTGSDIKRVKLYGEEKGGLIKDSGVLTHGRNSYTNAEEVGLLGVYYVEVEDYAGNTYGKRYPEGEELIPEEQGINILRLPKEVIKHGEEETYKVTLPKAESKKVVLQLRARLDYRRTEGCTSGLKILFNNTELKLDRLIDRKKTFALARGSIHNTYYNGGFATYYSPDFAPVAEDNPCCPVDIPNHDPYLFKFNISDLVKEGENTIVIKKKAYGIKTSLIVKDARIKFDAGII